MRPLVIGIEAHNLTGMDIGPWIEVGRTYEVVDEDVAGEAWLLPVPFDDKSAIELWVPKSVVRPA